MTASGRFRDNAGKGGSIVRWAVMAATGNQGQQVTRALLEGGHEVRALTRKPESPAARRLQAWGAVPVICDPEREASVREAFAGADGVFSLQNYWKLGSLREIRQGLLAVGVAQTTGVRHFIYSSGLGTDKQQSPPFASKRVLESAVRGMSVPWTILQPAVFMEDLAGASLPLRNLWQPLALPFQPVAGESMARLLAGYLRRGRLLPMVSLLDVGRAVAEVARRPEAFSGRTLPLVGDWVDAAALETIYHTVTRRRLAAWPVLFPLMLVAKPDLARMISYLATLTPSSVDEVPELPRLHTLASRAEALWTPAR